MVDTSKIKKVTIDKDKVKKNQDTLMSWLSSLFEGKNKNKKNVNPRGRSAARKIIASEVKKNPSITEIKKKVNAEIKPTKKLSGSDFEKPISNTPKSKTKKQTKDKKEGMGGRATVSPNQKSRQATLPKDSKTDSATVGKEQKSRQATLPKDEGMGGKATVSPNQKSRQANLPKEEGIGAKIARALGDKRSEEEMIRTRKMNEEDEKEMGMNKGGAVKKKYGMREGGFTKRGGMYKKGY